MNRRLLYILGGVAAFLALRWYLRHGKGVPAAAQSVGQTLLNWRLPWEIANTEETALAAAVASAQRNVTGFTPGQ